MSAPDVAQYLASASASAADPTPAPRAADATVFDPGPDIAAGRLHDCRGIAISCAGNATAVGGFSPHLSCHLMTDAVARRLAERGDPLGLRRLWRSAHRVASSAIGIDGFPERVERRERLFTDAEALPGCRLRVVLAFLPPQPGAVEGRQRRPTLVGRPFVVLALADEPVPPLPERPSAPTRT
jgi:hypothetical protein